MAVGDDRWELVTRGLPEAPTIRAIATHPEHPEIVYVGTQHGPYRSTDHGEHWKRLKTPDHGLPVWSLLFDPRDSKVLYAGYENCEIFRSEDGGERWQQLPVTVRFPEVTVAPGVNPAKRVLELAANKPADPTLTGLGPRGRHLEWRVTLRRFVSEMPRGDDERGMPRLRRTTETPWRNG